MDKFKTFTHIATATTTVVKSKQGILNKIICNDATSDIVTIYDNTAASGTVIAILAAGVLAGTEIEYDCVVALGITVVTAGADDITVISST